MFNCVSTPFVITGKVIDSVWDVSDSITRKIKGVSIEGFCSLQGALYGVLCENIDNHFMQLFSNGKLQWTSKDSNSEGSMNIGSIKLSTLTKTKKYITFKLQDVQGYQYYLKCKDNNLDDWFEAITDVVESNQWENDNSYELLQMDYSMQEMRKKYENRIFMLKQKNSTLSKDLVSQESKKKELEVEKNEIEVKNKELEIKYKELEDEAKNMEIEQKTYLELQRDDLPDWWCQDETYFNNEDTKRQGMWQWCDNNDNYHFYDKDVSDDFDQISIGSELKVKINGTIYFLRKDTKDQGTQRNKNTYCNRNMRSYKSVEKGFNYVNLHNTNLNIIYEAINTLKKTVNVKNVSGYAIQNEELYLKHKYLEKLWGKNKRCKNINVKYLFHGTDWDTITSISSNGFNRIFNTTSMYGKGVYFARDASYSMDYSSDYENDIGEKYKFLLFCRVICGDYSRGYKDQMVANNKQQSKILNETMVDDVNDPTIFVTTMDNQAYPLVLLKIPV